MSNRVWNVSTLAVAVSLSAGAGCGDKLVCPSEIVVAIGTIDLSRDRSEQPGLQVDVPIRSNLIGGDSITLAFVDGEGAELATVEGEGDRNGEVVFEAVTVPDQTRAVRVRGASSCGEGSDEAALTADPSECAVAIREGPIANKFYAPLDVLTTVNDGDGQAPDFQATIDVTTRPGYDVEVWVLDVDASTETLAGSSAADDVGQAEIPATLAQGRRGVRAVCKQTENSLGASSPLTVVFVDTLAPACDLANPPAGAAIIPALDIDGDPLNGTQIELVGVADPGASRDVEGEPAGFAIDGMETPGSAIDSSGQSALQVTFDTPGGYMLAFSTQDHAGNACLVARSHSYVTEGCAIALLAPLSVVTQDSDGDPTDGVQADLSVQVDTECAGQTVTTDCGLAMGAAVVPGDGVTDVEVTLCSGAMCEAIYECTARVTSPDGIETVLDVMLEVDNQPPNVSLQLTSPPLSCGESIAPADDVDGDPTNGVQIDVTVVSPFAAMRRVEVTSSLGTVIVPTDPGGVARITIESGVNDVIGFASDQHGNENQTGACAISLLDIAIGFDPPIDDGVANAGDGVVGPGTLTLDLCGTVSEPTATMTVSIDSGPAQPVTPTGNAWCLINVTLAESPPVHTIDVSAQSGPQIGMASLALTIDISPPGPVGSFAAITPNRHSVELSWLAADDGGQAADAYVIKIADQALTDANFDTTGTALVGPSPAAPGTPQSLLIEQLDAGQDFFFAIAAVDALGNRSTLATLGPVSPDFDSTGAVLPPNPLSGDNGFGYQLTRGDYNDDGFSDIAASAPFKSLGPISGVGAVYVYFGSAAGLGSPIVPDVVIEGTGEGQLGNGITTMRWDGDAIDDLVVSAPFSDNSNGQVFVFRGGPTFSAITGPSSADATITVASDPASWFFFSGLGFTLTTARFDSDGFDDLIMSAPNGGGSGGVVVLYGGSGENAISLSSQTSTGSGAARVRVIDDPDPAAFDLFGLALVNLGRTEVFPDNDDDIGVSYSENSSAYVLRGRPQPAGVGVTIENVDLASDLELQSGSADPTTSFGTALGSIADINGDGARDVIVGAWAEGNEDGQVTIVDGDATGAQLISAIALTTITPGAGVRKFGTAVVNNATAVTSPDINADGVEDLAILGGDQGAVRVFIWYGGSVPVGSTTSASADHAINAPAAFDAPTPPSGGTPSAAMWAGDVNGDGLEDICLADHLSNSGDGVLSLLWDDGV